MSNTISTPGGRDDQPFIWSRVQRNNRLRTSRRITAIDDKLKDSTLTITERNMLLAERAELEGRFR